MGLKCLSNKYSKNKFNFIILIGTIFTIIAITSLSLCLMPTTCFADDENQPYSVTYNGEDRYNTNLLVAYNSVVDYNAETENWDLTSKGLIITTGKNYPDALAASGLSGLLHYPIILADSKADLANAYAKIIDDKIMPEAVKYVIIGGENAISNEMESYIITNLYADENNIERIEGENRYDTSQKIYDYGNYLIQTGAELGGSSYGGNHWNEDCIVVSGKNFPDALSMSSYAYANQCPIFLADDNEPTYTPIMCDLYSHIYVAGGENAVSKTATDYLSKYCNADIEIFAGEDRYETSAKIALGLFEGNTNQASFVTGKNFPDALSAGMLSGSCWYNPAPIVLVDEGYCDSQINIMKTGNNFSSNPYPQGVIFIGGSNVINDKVKASVYNGITGYQWSADNDLEIALPTNIVFDEEEADEWNVNKYLEERKNL